MSERHGRLLAAFAERASRLAEDLCDRALAAEDPAEAAALAQAFHAVGRSMRQAIALEQRLEHAAAKADRDAREAEDARLRRLTGERRKTLRDSVEQVLFTERDWDDYCDGSAALDRLLNEMIPEPGFLAGDVQAQVDRLYAGVQRWLARGDAAGDLGGEDEDQEGEEGEDAPPEAAPVRYGRRPGARPALNSS